MSGIHAVSPFAFEILIFLPPPPPPFIIISVVYAKYYNIYAKYCMTHGIIKLLMSCIEITLN